MDMKNKHLYFYLIAVFFCIFHVYLHSLPPTVAPYRDSGEMSTVTSLLAIAHPPGYPLYVLLGKAASILIPFGDSAYRIALLSALCASSAVVVFTILIIFISGNYFSLVPYIWRLIFSGFAGLLFAFSDKNWYLAQVQEMYSLNALFALTVITLLIYYVHNRNKQALLFLAVFIFGLGLGNRLDLLFIIFFIMSLVLLGEYKYFINNMKIAMPLVIFFLLGISVYFYLIVRSRTGPLINWNDPSTFSQLIATVTRKTHGHTLDLLSTNYSKGKLFFPDLIIYFKQLFNEFSIFGMPFGLIGMMFIYRKSKKLMISFLAGFLGSGPLFIYLANMPPNPHALAILEAHLLLPNIFFCIFICFGVIGLAEILAIKKAKTANLLIMLFTIIILYQNNSPRAARSEMRENFFCYDYALNVLKTAPPGSIIVVKEDVQIFSLWYYQIIKNMRMEVACVAKGLSGSPWYQKFAFNYFNRLKSFRLTTNDGWQKFLQNNSERNVYFSSDVDLPNDFSFRSASFGLLHKVVIGENTNGQKNYSNSLLTDLYIYRTNYHYESQLNFFNADLIEDYAKSHMALGSEDMTSGDYRRAINNFRKALALKSVFPSAHYSTGYCYFQLEEFNKAYSSFVKATEGFNEMLDRAERYYSLADVVTGIKKDYSQTLINMGVLDEKKGNTESSIELYMKAIILDPNQAQAYFNLAVVYWKLEKWDDVVRLLEQVLKINPNFSGAKQYLEQARFRKNIKR
ncbi:MAG: DUF2723 domain-containing protein [bacterium]